MKHFSRMPCCTALLLTLVLPALAQKPTIIEMPFTQPFTITGGPANGACTFDVLVAPQEGRPNLGKIIFFVNGKALTSGPLFVTLTNLSTQKSINLNISGPSILTFSSSGVLTTQVLKGPTMIFGVPPNLTAEAGVPAVGLLNGRTTVTFDAQGNVISLSFNGTTEDLCQALQ